MRSSVVILDPEREHSLASTGENRDSLSLFL